MQEKLENMSIEKLMCEHYQHYSSGPKKKKMETTKCPSTDEWIYKYGISYNEIISIIRKYWYSLQHEWTFKIIMLSKRVQSEKDTGYSIYIKFPEETNN